jgi:hypothetical protein
MSCYTRAERLELLDNEETLTWEAIWTEKGIRYKMFVYVKVMELKMSPCEQ